MTLVHARGLPVAKASGWAMEPRVFRFSAVSRHSLRLSANAGTMGTGPASDLGGSFEKCGGLLVPSGVTEEPCPGLGDLNLLSPLAAL